MKNIKYRQSMLDYKGMHSNFVYWGFFDNGFFARPAYDHNNGINEARDRSELFIGLLDKHGKPIYEGDKVIECCQRAYIYTVVWDACSAGFMLEYDSGHRIQIVNSNNYEIIGNIHEGK